MKPFLEVWQDRINAELEKAHLKLKTGNKCTTCGNYNPDALPNQSDGTYICYECR